ncbi:hypothetical protein MBLNU459_g7683t1 [Dothideomycetes sp. NU459]
MYGHRRRCVVRYAEYLATAHLDNWISGRALSTSPRDYEDLGQREISCLVPVSVDSCGSVNTASVAEVTSAGRLLFLHHRQTHNHARPPPKSPRRASSRLAMDQQAASLLATLKRTSAASESKLTLLNNLKSDIKHHRVPDSAHAVIFECLKVAIAQQTSSAIVSAAFTTLSHLVKRLKIQDADGQAIVAHAPKLYSALEEKLGDLRESNRSGASQALADLWPFCGPDIENLIRDEVINSANARAKATGVQWVVKMHCDESLPFKSFVPNIVLCLEDSDGTVRDAAKIALVDLFSNAPDRAKADLKRQLNIHNVRKGIATQILDQVGSAAASQHDAAASTRSVPAVDHVAQFAESLNSEAARPPPPEEVPMDPIYVTSQWELEDMFRTMLAHFEGKESEDNWVARDKSVMKIRRLTKGNAPTDYHTAYMTGIKQLQDGILKVANSLRTTMSSNGCHLVQELARTLGPMLDPMVEIYLQSFIKMSAATKHIAAQNGNLTVDTIYQYVSYNVRTMQHIWLAAQDKNVQPRNFASGWLRTLLGRQAGSKTHFESSGGLELAEKIIKKGLNDPQPKVKESMRAAYWTFAKTWPDKADAIMANLDDKAKVALEKDSHNPNASVASSSSLRASTTSRAGGSASRASIRDAIIAQRRALAKSQNERPSSAMATLTPARTQSTANLRATNSTMAAPQSSASARVPSNVSTTSTSSTATKPNSLMSGAARRPVRRPEIARPATADPYATRRLYRPQTPSDRSPANSPRQETIASANRSAAISASVRHRIDRSSPAASPVRQRPSPKPPAVDSPRTLPRSRPSSKDSKNSIPEEANLMKEDDFTIVLPTRSNPEASASLPTQRPSIEKTVSVDSGVDAIVEDDNFTMVLPITHKMQRDRSPLVHRTTPTLSRSFTEDPTAIPLPSSARSSTSQRARRPSDRSDVSVTNGNTNGSTNGLGNGLPNNRHPSVPRHGSPLKASTPVVEEEFQIHEDPFSAPVTAHQTSSPSPQETRVLNELPVNESSQSATSPSASAVSGSMDGDGSASPLTNGVKSPSLSPESKADVLRSRKLLTSGIERIRGRTLDTHGFRKVLELVKSSESGHIFGFSGETRRFDDLCGALLDYIIEPSELIGGTARHSQDLKRQATTILKFILNLQLAPYNKWISTGRWLQRALTGMFDARRGVEGLGLLVKDIEALSTDIVARIRVESGEKAVATWLEHDNAETDDDAAPENEPVEPMQDARSKSRTRATAFALRTLAALLAKTTTTTTTTAASSVDINTRVAVIAATRIRSRDAEVRKAAVELATQLHASWPMPTGEDNAAKDDFWILLDKSGVQESARNLIVAFLESLNLAHGDLRPENILLDRDRLKLSDFDCTAAIGTNFEACIAPYGRVLNSSESDQGRRGGFGFLGPRTEQFALGSVYYLINYGYEVYGDRCLTDDPREHGPKVVDLLQDMEFPKLDGDELIDDVITKCWHYKYTKVADLAAYTRMLLQHETDTNESDAGKSVLCHDDKAVDTEVRGSGGPSSHTDTDDDFSVKKTYCQTLVGRGLLDTLSSGAPEELGFPFEWDTYRRPYEPSE